MILKRRWGGPVRWSNALVWLDCLWVEMFEEGIPDPVGEEIHLVFFPSDGLRSKDLEIYLVGDSVEIPLDKGGPIRFRGWYNVQAEDRGLCLRVSLHDISGVPGFPETSV